MYVSYKGGVLMKRTITILMLLLSVVLVACTPEDDGPIIAPDVESIEFRMDETTLTPGEHTLVAVALPEGSDQQMTFSIQGIVEGVSISGNKLTIGQAVADGTEFTVIAKSIYDPTVQTTIKLKVLNEGGDVVEISTEAELRAINTAEGGLSKSYVLTNDIELTTPWEPIGVADLELDNGDVVPGTPFTGVFDGQGFTISGIEISSEEPLFNAGFFAQIGPSAIVKNTAFEGSVVANGWSGGIAGINEGVLENVISNVTVHVFGDSAGSIVSVNRGLIRYAYGIGKVSNEEKLPTQGRSAGLVAANEGSMEEVYGDYQTLGTQNYIAFAPSTSPAFMLPTVDMKLASTWAAFDTNIWYVADGTYPLLKHEGFTPPVIELEVDITIRNTNTSLDLEVEDSLQIEAEVINPAGDEVILYALKESVSGVTIDAEGLVTFDLDAVAANFSFTVVASIDGTELSAEKTFNVVYNPPIVDDTVYIENETQLLNLLAGQTDPENLSKTFVLTNDIELTADWTAVGIAPNDDVVGVPFTGVFDGQGHKISGINMPGGGWNKGFFGYIGADGVVKNTHLEGYVEANAWSGGLVAVNEGTVQDVVVEINLYVYGSNGGVLVEHNHGLLKNIIVLGEVVSDGGPEVVGLLATNTGTLENVFANIDLLKTDNLVALQAVKDDGTHIISDTDFKLSSTYAAFDTDIWYVADGTHPLLKHEGFTPPVIELEVDITIKNTNTSLDLEIEDSLQIEAEVINPAGDEIILYALKEGVSGVTIDTEGLVTFDLDPVAANFSFTVVASIDGTELSAEKTFNVVYNPPIVDDTVYIENETQLLNLLAGQTDPENLSKTFVLTNDIELTADWTAVGIAPNEDEGVVGVPFTGVFDGQGYKISGINMPGGGWNKGFFGYIGSDGVIKNTHFEGYVEANAWSGGLVAVNEGTVQDVVVEIKLYVYGSNGGVLVEHNHGLLKNIIVLSEVVSDGGPEVVGLLATNTGTLENVFANIDLLKTDNLIALQAVKDDATHIISDSDFNLATTYAAFDAEIWDIPEEGIPTLKKQA